MESLVESDGHISLDKTGRRSRALWDTVSLGAIGAVVGILFGVADDFYHDLVDSLQDLMPFGEMLIGPALLAVAGALLVGGASWIRNRSMRR